MNPNIFTQRSQQALQQAHAIWNATPINFSDLTPSVLNEIEVVYIIALQDSDEVLYVGRTVNVRRRMYTNHLMGNKSTARLKNYLIADPNVPEVTNYQEAKEYLQRHCYFKYLPESDSRMRGMLEGTFSFLFDVRYIEKEH